MSIAAAVWVSTLSCCLAVACAGRGHRSDRALTASTDDTEIWWSPSLGLRSLSSIDKRLEEPFADPYDVERAAARSAPADRQVILSCASYFALQPRGYGPRSEVDSAALKVEGAKCHVVRALRTAKPARRRGFALTKDSLTELPAELAPAPSPLEEQRRTDAEASRRSWRSYQASASISVTDAFRARVTAADSVTDLEILAEADFDGDGTADALLLTISGGTEGSWTEIRLRLLTRVAGSPMFRTVKEFPL